MKKISIVVPLAENAKPLFLNNFPSSVKKDVEIIQIKGNNPSRNRNNGARKARGKYIAFINGHTSLSPDWSKNISAFFIKNKNIDMVGGPQQNSPDEEAFGRVSGYAMSSPFGAGGIWRRYGGKKEILDADETMLTSSNLICKRSVLKKVSFDENLYPGEDPKFIADAKKAGFSVAYSPKIIVYNKRRTNLFALSKQVFNYGFTRPKKEKISQTLKRPFFFIPSIFVLYILSLFFIHLNIYFFPLELYILLNILDTIRISIKYRDISALYLTPIIFVSIHLSYGIGFILGIFSNKK